MNSFEQVVWDDEGAKCTFYSVVKEGLGDSEMDRFLARFEQDDRFQQAIDDLLELILITIKERYGAINCFFNRQENQVSGLPPTGAVQLADITLRYPDFPLRLYVLKLSDNLVILFNGGIKDGPTNQTSSLHMVWQEACRFAVRIDDAIRSGEIIIDSKNRRILDHLKKPDGIFL